MDANPDPTAGRVSPLLALLLIVPAPTIGAAMMLIIAPGTIGTVATALCKIWILLLPLLWHRYVDRAKLTLPKLTLAGIPAAIGLGIVIMIAMLAAFYLIGQDAIDVARVREKAAAVFINTPAGYVLLFSFLILVNSLLEEYVWRWFVFRQCERLMPGWAAAVVSAALFTIHHVLALSAWVPPQLNLLGNLGVFVGATVWSGLYLKYRSIWAPYVCHVFADVAIFIMGWGLIIG